MVRRTGNPRVTRHLAARARIKQSTTVPEQPVPAAAAAAAQGRGGALVSDSDALTNAPNSVAVSTPMASHAVRPSTNQVRTSRGTSDGAERVALGSSTSAESAR
jgi:hypothetical protein